MKISNALQAAHAPAGIYKVTKATGLYLRVSETDAGSWFFRFRLADARRAMGLGSLAIVSLKEAREAALKAAALCRQGVDPIKARDRVKAENLAAGRAKPAATFKQETEAFLALHAPSWKHRYARTVWLNPIVKYAYPVIGDLSVNDIDIDHIVQIVKAARDAGAYETGQRVRTRVEAVFGAALARKHRDRSLGNPANAADIAAILPKPTKGEPAHFRRIPLEEAPAKFCALCEARAGASEPRAAALDAWLFMIATAARPSEALCARWSEIDLEKCLWTLPAARAKTGRTHCVPLSTLALEALERRRKVGSGDSVFPGRSGSPVGYPSFAFAPAEMGLDLGTPHSWRSIFRDWATEIGDIAPHLAELALAHALTKTQAAYARGAAIEPRRPVMEAFAKWVSGDAGADVIAFPTRA